MLYHSLARCHCARVLSIISSEINGAIDAAIFTAHIPSALSPDAEILPAERRYLESNAMIKILHVDDEADIRSITKLALESIGGFIVTSCSSGKEAVAAVTEAAPDLVVMDVMMPEMDGPTTFLELQKIPDASQIPVIFMTAKNQKDEIDSLMEVGAIGVIAKPFNPMQLSKEVERIWNARSTG